MNSLNLNRVKSSGVARRCDSVFGFGLMLTSCVPLQAQDRASVRKVAPVYPEMAKRMHIAGTIRVVATVDAGGSVVKAESDSPNKMLAPAAVDAVKRWKFVPADGTSTETIQVTFEPTA